ncbi:hypothetical protein GY21_08250 [Cryobacterium roopkundense]|uniref:Acyl-coenzyme A synthetase/AMP-(Fatty) acid ligase n=1 Tax=Cryobacterium roopkundense TaxID=1001240 RepID=A0A099JI77_9MICO|nr:AMP-binding protein [Cryobacterium roopkundense]KGJ77138.1 hypothetical protein GY21_08250 [Cryobacterium roopkundense]MBB5641490.1 acyl-coenzyme A synthetase/AMP-(fatty) acid ligase [Cryobacterium roopkundense]
MPFLSQLTHWAVERPAALAVEVGPDRLSYADLAARASARVGETAALSVLCLANGTEFVIELTAALSGNGSCAVLDAAWPSVQRHAVERRLQDFQPAPSSPRATSGTRERLSDGPADSVFLYGFTSGTTSLPKAFSRTRGSWPLHTSVDFFDVTEHDRTLVPGVFSAGLNLYALMESLHAGGTVISLPGFDVGQALACIRDRGVTRLVAVPSALKLIAERGTASNIVGTSITKIVSGGAKLDPVARRLLVDWAPRATIYEYYGAAELSFVSASAQGPGETSVVGKTNVGRPFPGVAVCIRDAAGHDVGPEQAGTIFVRSPLVSRGYIWGDDGRAFRHDAEWCTVGDQGFLAADGTLHHLGRRGDMIVTGGHNVYPQQVEAALEGVAGVGTVIVTGATDAARGSRVVAAILADSRVSSATLRAAAAALPTALRPRGYYLLTELPLSRVGKLSRGLLRHWIDEGDPRARPLD